MKAQVIKCPECDVEAEHFDDPEGSGYQCTNPECMALADDGDDS